MIVEAVVRRDEPGRGRVRFEAAVRYDDGRRETVWVGVPPEAESDADARGDAWVCALLPLAVAGREPLRSALPVDGRLLENLGRVMEVWRGWDPALVPVEIECDTASPGAAGTADAAFFSGGVDSMFTVLCERDRLPATEGVELDRLITVHGFDIPLAERAAFRRLETRHRGFAEARGFTLVPAATNLRETRWTEADWATLAHGAGFAAVAHALAPGIRSVRLASSSGVRDLRPWGSHPHTDPLFASSRLAIVHDGAQVRRLDKLARIAEDPAALADLRVCWRSRTDRNCGRCVKCLRTLAGLELLGARSGATSFHPDAWSLEYLETVQIDGPWDVRELRDLQELAARIGRWDIQRAIETALDPGPRSPWWSRFRRKRPRVGG